MPAWSRDAVHEYWRSPPDEGNRAERYAAAESPRSDFLVDIVRRHAAPEWSIFEIGCNAGRNLDYLYRAGFHNLAAVEISQRAIDVYREAFPAAAASTTIHVAPIEDVVQRFHDGTFDLVFSMAVLEHLHDDSAGVFPHIARITKRTLVTIEDERDYSERHFPRDYQRIFEPLGLRQVEAIEAVPDMTDAFVSRVFVRA